MKYLVYSDMSFRLSLNPCAWVWKPALAYDGPTPFFPTRRTWAFAFLFLQVFVDLSDGTVDVTKMSQSFDPIELADVVDQDDELGL